LPPFVIVYPPAVVVVEVLEELLEDVEVELLVLVEELDEVELEVLELVLVEDEVEEDEVVKVSDDSNNPKFI